MTKVREEPQATDMTSRTPVASLALVLALGVLPAACSGSLLDLGGADGGKGDACAPTTCANGQAWDANTCSCVTPPQTCLPPASCPPGTVFDLLLCTCVLKSPPLDAGADARSDASDAGLPPPDGAAGTCPVLPPNTAVACGQPCAFPGYFTPCPANPGNPAGISCAPAVDGGSLIWVCSPG